ncbi:hypothetical protein SAMN05444169_3083 [Bradyrhizobium erythrophlei]|uniref:Uncharacterized protein n=1 Tax=Bradyrhizobium erythrophlei TaxID=1437360 RepID=A0A1M5KUY7_9BRAD|nr:hypothetical protein SAMN05444169_3083 [Bradyrhizobium erythrophlei]
MGHFRKISTIGVAFIFGVILQSCAAVDQFGSRIEDANRNSQHANDQETLLNIVRAKNFRPLTFVAVSQVTGSQTETVTTGLPTITFGSGITPAQHIGQITNSVMGQAQGSYQSNPLVSTQFQTGMLAAIPEETIAYLIAAHPRDPVLFSTIDALIIKVGSTGKLYRLDNNPDEDEKNPDKNDPDKDCPTFVAEKVDVNFFERSIPCSYSTFLRVTNFILGSGLTAEIISSNGNKATGNKAANKGPGGTKGAASTGGSGSATSSGGAADGAGGSTQSVQGRFCFDPTKSARGVREPLCSVFKLLEPKTSKKAKVIKFGFGKAGTVEAQILIKSPLGVYELYGAALRHPWPHDFPYAAQLGQELIRGEPFVNVTSSPGACFVDVTYQGQYYCVPANSQNTPVIFDIVEQLKNLSTTPTDLNAPFAVRFVGN